MWQRTIANSYVHVHVRAFGRGGTSCLFAATLIMHVDHFSYPTCTCSRWCLSSLPVPVPDPGQRFLPKITLGRVTPTIPHLAKAIGLLYLYLMVIVLVSYACTGIPAVRVGSGPTHGRRKRSGRPGGCRPIIWQTRIFMFTLYQPS